MTLVCVGGLCVAPDASVGSDGSTDPATDGGAVNDTGTGPVGSLCDGAVPTTATRKLECGANLCDLDTTSPPLRCCIGSEANSGTCIMGGEACPSPKFAWTCTRGFQCPYPAPCCLSTTNRTNTCPVTATALESRCGGGTDGGCDNDLELCTGNEVCTNGKTCQVMDILGPERRSIGACL